MGGGGGIEMQPTRPGGRGGRAGVKVLPTPVSGGVGGAGQRLLTRGWPLHAAALCASFAASGYSPRRHSPVMLLLAAALPCPALPPCHPPLLLLPALPCPHALNPKPNANRSRSTAPLPG